MSGAHGGGTGWALTPPRFGEIEEAAQRLEGQAVITPLVENQDPNAEVGGRLLVKAEMLQRTGSFKFRGAYNRISQLDEAERARGVIAYSSGNHAQAVACAAGLVGTRATIVMPTDAPGMKVARTRKYGAEIVMYDRAKETREDVARRIGEDRGLVMVPPNEDRRVLAGAGTVGREIGLQLSAVDARADAVLVPCGGGGLTAATALAFKEISPGTEIYAVEPEQFDDTRRSFEAGRRLPNPPGRRSICDAIMTDIPGELTFSINKDLLAGVLTVSDDEAVTAMRAAFYHFKLVLEPGGAVALAAVLSRKFDANGMTIAIVASGGNVDLETYKSLLAG
jgi:threonine dehydratase